MRFAAISLLVLISAAPATQPEIRRGIPMATTNPDERARLAFDRIIKRVEPSMKGDPARLELYLDAFRHEFIEDPRLIAASFQANRREDGTIELTGFAEYVEHRQALIRFLRQLGFDRIDDQVVALPDASLGDRVVGFVCVDRSFVYDKTSPPRETVSECLRDEPAFLLRKIDDHYLIHCADGYLGYIPAGAVRPVDRAEFAARLTRFDRPGTRQTVDRIIDRASRHIGAKYVWGGRSDDGMDCSGLVQIAFKSDGINLPRDADQQSGVGTMVATRACRAGLRRGDLLFFLSRTGTVRHVAIYLGEQKFLQAEDGGARTSSFDPKDPSYDAKHDRGFCFAKRVIE